MRANLRDDKGYTYGVGAGIYTMACGGYMCVSADVGNEHLKRALAEIHSEMDRLASEKVEEDELLLVKQYLSGSYLRSVDGVFNQLSLLSQLNKHHLGKEWMENYLARLDNITSDDILKFAGQYLDYDSMVLVTC